MARVVLLLTTCYLVVLLLTHYWLPYQMAVRPSLSVASSAAPRSSSQAASAVCPCAAAAASGVSCKSGSR